MSDLGFKQFIASGTTTISNLLLQRYRDVGMTEAELAVFIQTKAMLDQGASEPNTAIIAKYMGTDAKSVFKELESMRVKGLLEFTNQHNAGGRLTTQVNMQPLYDRLIALVPTDVARVNAEKTAPTIGDEPTRADIFRIIEQEFGRMLTPFELEDVTKWFDVDHFKPVMIKEAVKEAVLNQAYNLKYIQSILINWDKNNIRTLQAVDENRKRRQQHLTPNNGVQSGTNKPHVPLGVDLLNLKTK
ncbi:MAG: DnaD domain protein [Lactobacillaceae bacterium]|jgi:DNA replication protein|nr:DnaD domain protein [Lactobacillaceae bacterium]